MCPWFSASVFHEFLHFYNNSKATDLVRWPFSYSITFISHFVPPLMYSSSSRLVTLILADERGCAFICWRSRWCLFKDPNVGGIVCPLMLGADIWTKFWKTPIAFPRCHPRFGSWIYPQDSADFIRMTYNPNNYSQSTIEAPRSSPDKPTCYYKRSVTYSIKHY